MVETDDVISHIKALQKEIKQLKKHMEGLVDDTYIEIAAQKPGYKSVLEHKTCPAGSGVRFVFTKLGAQNN